LSVVQPLRDHNGEPIAAVRVVLRPYPGQTQQAVLQRALPIVREMQARVRTLPQLRGD
jgi:DNA-binding IclR family transcriptional regulator